jgi:sugar transferase (PEP-CTERM/EpsH1 system associated)
MESLRILHILHSLNTGGLERVAVDLAKGFRNKDCHVSICCLDGGGGLTEEAKKAEIKVLFLNKSPGIAWGLPRRISKIIREEQSNVVHTHNEAGLVYGVPGAFLAGVSNIVHTEHGKEPNYADHKALHIIERFFLKRVKHVITVSEDLKTRIVKSRGIRSEKVSIIHNGIDTDNFFKPECRYEKRKKLGIGPEIIVMGNIARLVPLKNHQFLLGIFKELLKNFANLKLVLVGDGPLMKDLKIISQETGISDSVMFLGERKDVAELLAVFDLFILPSLTEGISITLLEAMAAGKVVIASEVGGNSEIVENGKTGMLIPLGDTSRWVEIIKSIIKNNDIKNSFSENARWAVAKRFGLGMMVESYEKIYRN